MALYHRMISHLKRYAFILSKIILVNFTWDMGIGDKAYGRMTYVKQRDFNG